MSNGKVDNERIEKIKKIILDGDNKILNQYSAELAKKYAPQNEKEKKQKLTTSQIRNILDDVQRMGEGDIKAGELEILRPKLAYIAGRHSESWALRELRDILDTAIGFVGNDSNSFGRFKNFRNFFEAIVGYHKFYSKVKD